MVRLERVFNTEAKQPNGKKLERLRETNLEYHFQDSTIKLFKDKKISEDDEKRGLEDMQKLTDEFIGKIEAQGTAKEKEILELH